MRDKAKKSEPVTTLQSLTIKPMRGVNYCPTDLMRGPLVHPATQSSLFASSTFRHQIYVLICSALVLQLIHSGDCQPERTGPEVFPSFTWASQLCATGSLTSLTSPRSSKQQEAVWMTSDFAGNIFAAGNGMLCKYGQDGRLRWARPTTGAGNETYASMNPRVAVGSLRSLFVPGARGESVVFVTGDEGLRAIDGETGNLLWQYSACGEVQSTPLVVQTAECKLQDPNNTASLLPCRKNMVVFGSEKEQYYALTFNGTLIWTSGSFFRGTSFSGWPLRFSASFGNNSVFVLSSRGLSALGVDGKFKWAFWSPLKIAQTTGSSRIKKQINSLGPVYSDGMVAYSSGQSFYVISVDGVLLKRLIISPTGTSSFDTPMVDFTTSPAWYGSLIFIGDSNSTLHCINLKGTQIEASIQWRYQFSQHPQATLSSLRTREDVFMASASRPSSSRLLRSHNSGIETNMTHAFFNTTNDTKYNMTNDTKSAAPTRLDVPIAAPIPPPHLQPVWDEPVVGKNGLVYLRGPKGLHAIDAWTGTVAWVYAAQPLESTGRAIPDIAEIEASGNASFRQVHIQVKAWASGVCGGAGQAECRENPMQISQHALKNQTNCNSSNVSNSSPKAFPNASPNTPDCFLIVPSENPESPENLIECGEDVQHGRGHLTSDGSFVLPCRGAVHRMCCASCSVSVFHPSSRQVYPGESVHLILEGALSRNMTTMLLCLWYDERKILPSITTAASYFDEPNNETNRTGLEGLVRCGVPDWDFSMYLPFRVVQQDAAGSLRFCGGKSAGVDMMKIPPPPPPSYALYYIVSAISAIILCIIILSLSFRKLFRSYVRHTELELIEPKFSAIGMGGLKYDEYIRLLKFLKHWYRRQLEYIFNRCILDFKNVLEQVDRRLWKSDHPVQKIVMLLESESPSQEAAPAMHVADLADIAYIFSRECARSPTARMRVRDLMERVLQAQPHRADLWQLYINLELQVHNGEPFRHTSGDIFVQIRGVLVCHPPSFEFCVRAKCANTKWSTPRVKSQVAMKWSTSTVQSKDVDRKNDPSFSQQAAQKRFFSYFSTQQEYSEGKLDATTSFSVHHGFESESNTILDLQLCRCGVNDGAAGARLPAQVTMPSELSQMHVFEESMGHIHLPIDTLANCRTTLEIEVLEVNGLAETSKWGWIWSRAPHRRQVLCRIQCVASGAENGNVQETPWVDVLPTGRAAIGSTASFFLPGCIQSKRDLKEFSETKEEDSKQKVSVEQLQHEARNRKEYVLPEGATTTMWGISGNEYLTTKSHPKGENNLYDKKEQLWQQTEHIRQEWKQRDRVEVILYSRELDTRRHVLGSCPVALDDLKVNHVYDQWLPLQTGKICNGFVRVRLRRREVQNGEMSEPFWLCLVPSSNTADDAWRAYVKIAFGFVPRLPDVLNLSIKHDFEVLSAHPLTPVLKCHALLQAGAITKTFSLSTKQDVSIKIDDHTSVVRIGILGEINKTLLLGDLVIAPCPDAGATMKIEDTSTDNASWKILKTSAVFASQVQAARKEARALFREWVRNRTEVLLEQARAAVDEGDYTSAESIFVSLGKADLAVNMYTDACMLEEALRVEKTHESVLGIIKVQAESLSSMELKTALRTYGLHEDKIVQLLHAVDQNSDGIVTLHEFVIYGMRFLHPHLAEFHQQLISHDAEAHAYRYATELTVLAIYIHTALSTAAKATLCGCILYYVKIILRCMLCRCPYFSTCSIFYDCSSSRDSDGEVAASKDVPQKDGWSSAYRFSKTMPQGETVNLEAEYYRNVDEPALSVHGTLMVKMRLVSGEHFDMSGQEDQIETIRALFLRILSCRHLTAPQISRFVSQCEQWEERLKLRSPATTFPSECEMGLSPVAERSFEEYSEDLVDDPEIVKSSAHALSRNPKIISRPASSSGRQDRPLSGRPSSSRPPSAKRPMSARSFGSIRTISSLSSQKTPGYRKAADATLRESLSSPSLRRATSRSSSIPGCPRKLLNDWKDKITVDPYDDHTTHINKITAEPACLEYDDHTARSSSDEGFSDESESSSAILKMASLQQSAGHTKPPRPQTAPQPIEAQARRSIFLQNKVVPWREVISSGCLIPVDPQISSHHAGSTDRFFEQEGEAAGQEGHSVVQEREDGRNMLRNKLRAWSARRFRVTDARSQKLEADPRLVSHLAQEILVVNKTVTRNATSRSEHGTIEEYIEDGKPAPKETTIAADTKTIKPKGAQSSEEHPSCEHQFLELGWKSAAEEQVPDSTHQYVLPYTARSKLKSSRLDVVGIMKGGIRAERVEKHRPATAGQSTEQRAEAVGSQIESECNCRPATASSSQFTRSRERSLKRLLSASNRPPTIDTAAIESDTDGGTGFDTDDDAVDEPDSVEAQRHTIRSPFKLLEGRKKMSKDLAKGGWSPKRHPLSTDRRPATANNCERSSMTATKNSAGENSLDQYEVSGHAGVATARATEAGVVVRGGCRPMTANPAGREMPSSVAGAHNDSNSLPRWQREGGITPSIHRLHCKLDDLPDTFAWRNFDDISPEKKQILLSFMKSTDRDVLMTSSANTQSADSNSHQPGLLEPPAGLPPTRTRPSTAAAAAKKNAGDVSGISKGAMVKDVWLARANLKLAKARHARNKEILAEEVKWIYDRRIKVKGEITADGEGKTICVFGLGQEDYKGLAGQVQGDYKKSARIECGRPVFERFGGVAMWFVRDCEGGSQPADKDHDDEGEWWVGPLESVGFGGDMLLGPPARGLLRVRDQATNPAKILHSWRVYRP